MAKIINLRVENIKGITEAEAELNGQSVTIGGKNGQGKSSLQEALKMALGGKDFVPAEPVRKGAEKGLVFTCLDNGYTVEFSVTADRKTKLKIRHKDNPHFASDSVTLLKSLFGALSFDPGEWMATDHKAKLETLRRLTGLDFSSLNLERKDSFEERTIVGREVKRLEGQLSGLARHKDAPEQEEDSKAILAEIEAAQRQLTAHEADSGKVASLIVQAERCDAEAGEIRAEIERLQAKLVDVTAKATELRGQAADLRKQVEGFEAPDLDSLKARLAGVEETNRKVRENREHAKVKAELEAKSAEYQRLTDDIERIDREKRDRLADASLPVEGLTFDEDGIRFNGTPWEQCSESEQWDIATAMAFALNPNSVVFMSKSGGLDRETRARVLERARQLGVQLLLEVVDDAEDVQILIDRGEIVENRLTAEAGKTA